MDTVLKAIQKKIQTNGPLPVDEFMNIALYDTKSGYYASQTPIGKDGDFVTSPEISPLFGEMIGLWLLDKVLQQSQFSSFALLELGPGRGTLMTDLLRVFKHYPDVLQNTSIHLVEASETLMQSQKNALQCDNIHWHTTVEDALKVIGQTPLLLVANEFFDALPVKQYITKGQKWKERVVDIENEHLKYSDSDLHQVCDFLPIPEKEQAIYEHSPFGQNVGRLLADHMHNHGGYGLIIDYGYLTNDFGDTLQGVSKHKKMHPLKNPGQIDLSHHVNFPALEHLFAAKKTLETYTETQQDFLIRNGIEIRAEQYKRKTTTPQNIDLSLYRLTSPQEMGHLFKVLSIITQ